MTVRWKREFEIDGAVVAVRVDGGSDGYRVHVGDDVLDVGATPVGGGLIRVRLDGERWVTAAAVNCGDHLQVRVAGRTWELPIATRAGRAGGGTGGGNGRIEAPMTGTVLEVRVAVGDDVALGDPVAVLSAMKMEHKLEADVDGRVAEVDAAAGDSVEQGHVLVRIEPASS